MSDAVLKAIKELGDRLVRIEKMLASSGGRNSGGGGAVADDRDLDSQYGDPEVRKDPKRWIDNGGESFAGMPYSRCPPEFLDELASFKEWQAQKDLEGGIPEKQKYVGYARKDAARARGWAARLRAGWKPSTFNGSNGGGNARGPAAPADAGGDDFGFGGGGDDDIPFLTSLPNRRGL